MDSMDLDRIIEALDGSLAHGNARGQITGVSIDSRKVRPGDLFFAFPGTRVDGHDFLDQVFEQGAAGAVISRPVSSKTGRTLIMVPDPLKALQDFARFYRSLFKIPVVAVTGSTGKTTTKDLIAAVLGKSLVVLKTEGNYNNEIGLPLTLLQLDRRHQVVVLEMGMRGLGEIAALCEISSPEVGVITNIGKTHLELLGSQEKIAKAKGELLDSLPPEGSAVLYAQDPWQLKLARMVKGDLVFYGMENSQVSASQVTLNGLEASEFILRTPIGEAPCFLPLPGKHNVLNALAAAAVGHRFGMTPKEIAAGLASVSLTGMRLEVKPGIFGSKLIDDSYNASPASTKAALELLAASGDGRKLAVLGDMYELGYESVSGHRAVGEKAAVLEIDCLCAVGELAREIASGALAAGLSGERVNIFKDKQQATAFLKTYIQEGDVVLIKGSRGMQLEEITASLQEG